MKAEFNLSREQSNRLYLASGADPNVGFHFHSQIEIQMIDEGEVEVWVNEHREILRAGEVSVAFSYDAHGYRTPEKAHVTCMIIPIDLCKDFLPSIRRKRIGYPFIRDRKIYEQLKDCYRAAKESRKSRNELKTRGYLYVILGTLLEQMELEDRGAEIDPTLSTRMLFYINEHFRDRITLDTMAMELGFNPSYLSRYFKACFSIGFNQYLTMLRLRESVLLMQEGKIDISGCAFESGFNSIRTFYRAFYEEFGCTPKEYMNRMKI